MKRIDLLIELLRAIYDFLQQYSERHPISNIPHEKDGLLPAILTKQQVMDYLHISESTYKRQVKRGILKPMELGGGHCYYPSDLQEALWQSRRRGRV